MSIYIYTYYIYIYTHMMMGLYVYMLVHMYLRVFVSISAVHYLRASENCAGRLSACSHTCMYVDARVCLHASARSNRYACCYVRPLLFNVASDFANFTYSSGDLGCWVVYTPKERWSFNASAATCFYRTSCVQNSERRRT